MKVSDALLGDFGSHPSEQDLILTYLRPRVAGGADAGRSWGFVHSADVYSADPADLTARFRPAIASNGERAWYFFSPLRNKTGGARKARTVGGSGGCWHAEHALRGVYAGIRHIRQIGRRQSFSFTTKVGDKKNVRSGWLMVEIRLNADEERPSTDEFRGTDGKGKDERPSQIVLCKVYRSPRAKPACTPMKPWMAAAAASGLKRKADNGISGEEKCARLCARCSAELTESESRKVDDEDSVGDEDEPEGRSESGVLEEGCSTPGQSDETQGDETETDSETIASSENRGKSARPKLHKFFH